MTPDPALAQLPVAHAVALRRDEAGVGADLIAQALGVEAAGVGPLSHVALAKLARLLDGSGRPAPGDGGRGSPRPGKGK